MKMIYSVWPVRKSYSQSLDKPPTVWAEEEEEEEERGGW
jgi:hypothetical protein